MSDVTSLKVEFLFHLHATLDAPVVIPNGPHGTRVIVGINGGTVKGPKVNGTVAHLGADWLTIRADGTAQLDVRALITTDDGGVGAAGQSGNGGAGGTALVNSGGAGVRLACASLDFQHDECFR